MRKRTTLKHLHWWAFIFCMAITFPVLAQSGKITGTVTDEKGQPIQAVTVQDPKTKKMVMTDENGKFSIEAGENSKLVFSSAGFGKQEVVVSGQTVVTVKMAEDVKTL
ncbi:MAG TPA: carboxypeptidase-like regulatory domain-containing protein, partial [Niastella sp.]|nr:carboxypeptidase-like regulatory domain-containing protein [Niastella sp.]